jgi:hypothetical protein
MGHATPQTVALLDVSWVHPRQHVVAVLSLLLYTLYGCRVVVVPVPYHTASAGAVVPVLYNKEYSTPQHQGWL